MRKTLTINGFPTDAAYDDRTVTELFIPFLKRLAALQKERGERLVVLLGAPPAAGKSTMATFLEALSRETDGCVPLQALGMDGFHYPQAYILTHTVFRDGRELPMKRFKGAPDTFDIARLRDSLSRLKRDDILWPVYDRTIHDVRENALRVTASIVLVEGNYLLLDRDGWRDLPGDYRVAVSAEEADLKPRLIGRKMRGGLSREQAEAFYEECDSRNVRLCLSAFAEADERWRLETGGALPSLSRLRET